MTTITIYTTNTGVYQGFLCKGHAGFANSGKDIVCASVSVLVINTINSIEMFVPEEHCEVKTDANVGLISFQLKGNPALNTKLLLDSMVLGLKEIETQYGKKYLKLNFKEV